MGKETKIGWCDSTCNPAMGCDGCELWHPTRGGTCYAADLTARYGGTSKGFPIVFDVPKVFPGRVAEACRWGDLTGKPRPGKPWLDGYPRTVFLGDMGDLFTGSLFYQRHGPDRKWWGYVLGEELALMRRSPHVWIWLTKRTRPLANWWRKLDVSAGPGSARQWAMTSVTSQPTVKRLDYLMEIEAPVHGVSFEPLLGPIRWDRLEHRPEWVILGGESGPRARPCDLGWLRDGVAWARSAGARVFVKQLGSAPSDRSWLTQPSGRIGKGEDLARLCPELNLREMPLFSTA